MCRQRSRGDVRVRTGPPSMEPPVTGPQLDTGRGPSSIDIFRYPRTDERGWWVSRPTRESAAAGRMESGAQGVASGAIMVPETAPGGRATDPDAANRAYP